ncbi:hypothetical protein M9458_054393, partial [Cirrhinus mrigala]
VSLHKMHEAVSAELQLRSGERLIQLKRLQVRRSSRLQNIRRINTGETESEGQRTETPNHSVQTIITIIIIITNRNHNH